MPLLRRRESAQISLCRSRNLGYHKVLQGITGHWRSSMSQPKSSQTHPKPTPETNYTNQPNMPSNMSLLSCEANRSPRYSKVSSTSATNTTNAWWLTVWTGWCIRLKFCGAPQYQRIENLANLPLLGLEISHTPSATPDNLRYRTDMRLA